MLADRLLGDGVRERLIASCVELVEHEVSNKSGLSGMGIRGAFNLVQKLSPGIVERVVSKLAPEFVRALEPFYDPSAPDRLADTMRDQTDACAEALLAVTDERVKTSRRRRIRGAYEKLRPIAHKQVAGAVPALAERLQTLL